MSDMSVTSTKISPTSNGLNGSLENNSNGNVNSSQLGKIDMAVAGGMRKHLGEQNNSASNIYNTKDKNGDFKEDVDNYEDCRHEIRSNNRGEEKSRTKT